MVESDKQPVEKDRKTTYNLWRFHGDGAASAVDDAAANYQAPSIIAAGANAQSISLLTMLVNLGLSLVCIKAPAFIERIGLTKKGAVTLAFLNICAWVPLIIAFFLSPLGIGPVWFALLWLVNVIPGIFLTFQRDNWLSNLVPSNKLGRYLGQRLAIKSAFYLGAFCFLGYLLDSMGGNEHLVNFAVVLTVALAVALVDFVIFTFMYDPKKQTSNLPQPNPEHPKVKFGLFDFIGELRTKKLDGFVIFTSLFYLTVGLSGPLYAIYMLEEQRFSYLSFTVIIAAEYLARVISAPFWGRFADRAGNIRVLGIVSRIIPAIPICWLFCSNVGYLAVVQIISGVCWGAFDLCTQSYVFKIAPAEKKLRYIIYTRCLILFSTALGGLGGVYLIKTIFPIFGSRTLSVFLISGFLRMIIVMLLMSKLVDLAISYFRPTNTPEVNLDDSGKAKVSKRGLFYFRDKPAVIPMKRATMKQNTVALYSQPHNIARQRAWVIPEKSAPINRREFIELPEDIKIMPRRNWLPAERGVQMRNETAQTIEITPIRRPWFKDSDISSAYAARNLSKSLEEMEKNNREKSTREKIFYDSGSWNGVRQTIVQADERESTKINDTYNIRPVYVTNNVNKFRGAPGSDIRSMLPKMKK